MLTWSLRAGGWLGVGNDPVTNTPTALNKFPFPAASEAQQARIRDLAERLDAHRKRQQARHPALTLTDMYNVLDRLRALDAAPTPADDASPLAPRNSPLTAKERTIHEQGLVAVLKQLHDELDAAVAEAYGWPVDLPDAELLQRLVDLNARRAVEEAAGHIRWLRPAYQLSRAGAAPLQSALVDEETGAPAASVLGQPLPWPATMPEQARAVRTVLQQAAAPLSAPEVAALFGAADRARLARIGELLETLASLGQAQGTGDRYAAL